MDIVVAPETTKNGTWDWDKLHRRIERHDMLCKRLLQRIRRKPVVVAHTKDRHKFKDILRHLVRAQNREDDFFNQLYRRDKKADCSSELSMNVSVLKI
jgi:hypothetical protein